MVEVPAEVDEEEGADGALPQDVAAKHAQARSRSRVRRRLRRLARNLRWGAKRKQGIQRRVAASANMRLWRGSKAGGVALATTPVWIVTVMLAVFDVPVKVAEVG
jgi:hypothetical protein